MTGSIPGSAKSGTFLVLIVVAALAAGAPRLQHMKGAQSPFDDTSKYPSARENPTVYPGERPPQAYLLEGTKIRLIKFMNPKDIHSAQIPGEDGTSVSLDERLRQLGAA